MRRGRSADWDKLARFYNWQVWLERPALLAALELADPRPQDRLLDLGTGTAALLRELARRQPQPAAVVGIDASEEMLARVPALPQGWRLEPGDVRALPFPDESFDVVTASYLLHLLDEKSVRQTLAEARRVLVDGGRFVSVTPGARPSVPGRTYAAAATLSARLFPSLLAGLRPYDPRGALTGSGFTIRTARYVRAGYPSLCVLALRT